MSDFSPQVLRDAVYKRIKGNLQRKESMAKLYLYPEEVSTLRLRSESARQCILVSRIVVV